MSFPIPLPRLDDTPNLLAARRYARLGWTPVPCHTVLHDGHCSCARLPCGAVGKHPTRSFTMMTEVTPEDIDRWWKSYPVPNVAVRTGNGLVVIDVDNKPTGNGRTGVENFERLVAEHDGLPDTVTTLTPSGGIHYYWSTRDVVHNYQRGAKVVDGVDVRGHNGYVLAPPSRHRSGGTYAWKPGHSPSEVGVQPIPRWLLERCLPSHATAIDSPRGITRSPIDRTDALGARQIPIGMRHDSLLRIAGFLRHLGLDEIEIGVAMACVNAYRCASPVGAEEVHGIVRWVSDQQNDRAGNILSARMEGHDRVGRLTSLASRMARHGLQWKEITETVLFVNARRCVPPLADPQIVDVVVNALRAGWAVAP